MRVDILSAQMISAGSAKPIVAAVGERFAAERVLAACPGLSGIDGLQRRSGVMSMANRKKANGRQQMAFC